MAAKFFTGLPLDGPDPECVQGYGEQALEARAAAGAVAPPKPSDDHSHRTTRAPRPVAVAIGRRPDGDGLGLTPPVSACAEDPLAGFVPR
jgi:hypothetical protein